MDLDEAMKNPARTFKNPEAVCHSSELSSEQKHAVLQQWKQQLELEQTADSENMQAPGVANSGADMLQRVSRALLQLEKA